MAEWLRRGLQILARRFDSGSGLHFFIRLQLESLIFAVEGGSVSCNLLQHQLRSDGAGTWAGAVSRLASPKQGRGSPSVRLVSLGQCLTDLS